MIESITLANIASYASPVTVDKLKQINFFYGANGAGKTSISRLIGNPSLSTTSQVSWLKGLHLETLVYNNDFIEKNYTSVPNLKGVFTLGEAQQTQLDEISTLKKEIGALGDGRDKHQENLENPDGKGGKLLELSTLEAAFKDKCWAQKRKYDDAFAGAFSGLRSNSEHFKTRILSEKDSNISELIGIETLTEKAKLLYGNVPDQLVTIQLLNATPLIQLETDPVLQKKVLGKSDVDIAAMIAKLNNSDWVRQGLPYFKESDNNCPFCQQTTSANFEKSLSEYFDESFENDTKSIETLRNSYKTGANFLHQQIAYLTEIESEFIDKEKLDANLGLLSSLITINLQRIESKKSEPSSEISLEPISQASSDIAKIINDANTKISEQNKLVANFKSEQSKLTGQIWKYILETELKDTLTDYDKAKTALVKAIAGLTAQIDKAKAAILLKDKELKELESKTTSIQPTVTAINRLLRSFGFKGFSLAVTTTGDSYRLIRADGTDAKTTLSEGEKTFVTFLYFYHLLKGSPTTTGITADRVVVIDDPVSSLDSDILFIVASLIKKLFTEVREGNGYLKQIFILTHNVYFHKEITFHHKRNAKGSALSEETFWIVRKPDQHSKVERYDINPIKTSYELLWAELRKPDPQNLTIQNTLRRILENYFKILGGIDLQDLWEHFDGDEAIHCRSLISWVNDGSHFAHDDLYVVIDEPMVASYLKVFFKIFKQTKHMPHYQMMMGEQYIDLDPDVVEAEARPELGTEPAQVVHTEPESFELSEDTELPIHAAQSTAPDQEPPLALPSIATPQAPTNQDLPPF